MSHLIPRETEINIHQNSHLCRITDWKGPLRSQSPTINLTLMSLPLNHVPPQPYIALIPYAHILSMNVFIPARNEHNTEVRLVHPANITLLSHHLRKGKSCSKPTLPVWKGYGVSWSHFSFWLWLLESPSMHIWRARFSPTIQQFLHTFIPATDFSINFPVQIFPCTILKVAGHLCRKLTQIPNIPNWNSYGK